MKFTAFFYKLNDDFSPEYAASQNDGEPSENNRMHEWEDELALKNQVKSIDIQRNANYILRGEQHGGEFEEPIDNMIIFNIIGQDETVTQMACSEELLERFEVFERDELKLEVHLKGLEPLSNPIPGIYIALQKFPKNLID